MAWVYLLVSAVLEAVWATALGRSNGFTEPVATVVFFVATVLSVLGLAQAMRGIPIGTAYAVWTGVGSELTVAWAAISGDEKLTPLKVVFLAGIIGCVVGLKKLEGRPEAPAADASVGTSNGEVS